MNENHAPGNNSPLTGGDLCTAILTKAKDDAAFRSKLLDNPKKAITEAFGTVFSSTAKVRVTEDLKVDVVSEPEDIPADCWEPGLEIDGRIELRLHGEDQVK